MSFSWLAKAVVVCLALGVLPAPAAEPSGSWLLIDTQAETLTVMGERGPLRVFDNIAVGVRGVGVKQQRGDAITPLGSFRVGWINPYSQFKLFFGLDYPNLEHARLALYDGRIDDATFNAISRELAAGRSPPQETPLGGQIGIHGLGGNDPYVHANSDWTNGCVALTNEQIDALARWVKVGTRVEIR